MILGPRGERRLAPKLPVTGMISFELHQPRSSHFRVATCAEVECEAYRNGWTMGFDLTNAAAVKAANWVRNQSGLAFTFERLDTRVIFTFKPGQRCLESYRSPHYVPLERDPIAVRRSGDWRGNPDQQRRVHSRLDDWVDEFANHQDRVATRIEQG